MVTSPTPQILTISQAKFCLLPCSICSVVCRTQAARSCISTYSSTEAGKGRVHQVSLAKAGGMPHLASRAAGRYPSTHAPRRRSAISVSSPNDQHGQDALKELPECLPFKSRQFLLGCLQEQQILLQGDTEGATRP